ncbi:tRNA pseudouridine synthase D [Halioglobus japonicus]|nr:tRNA pseudouridine synthase D [Halioglobus japonicus]
MRESWPRVWGEPCGSASIRCCPEDFQVSEQLGFEVSGEGEHCFLHLQKRQLNTLDLLQRVSTLSSVPLKDIGYCGLKDRNAVTRQWLSVGMAGRQEPDWRMLEREGDVQVLAVGRHARKLRRGVHRANHFTLVLRELNAEPAAVEQRLQALRAAGVPNYFGEQRFGRNGSTLEQAQRWMRGGRRISRTKRSLYFSALRAYVFNRMLALRVEQGDWNQVLPGDVCVLQGTRSHFRCAEVTDDIRTRAAGGDIHPGLPLWGRGQADFDAMSGTPEAASLAECREICAFLEASGLELAWRPTRLLADDFCWQFCDDDTLQLDFSLGAGSYATALLSEFVQYKEGYTHSGISSEQD